MASTGSICIVAHKLLREAGAVDSAQHPYQVATALAARGWRVHVLCCEKPGRPRESQACRDFLEAHSVTFHLIDETPKRLEDTLEPRGMTNDLESLHVLGALRILQEQFRFDLIEFEERDGTAFRSVQARRMGVCLQEAKIIVRLSGPRQWCRHADRRWPTGISDSLYDYFEQYAFEKADYQFATSASLLQNVELMGWDVHQGVALTNPLVPQPSLNRRDIQTSQPELVFLGPLGLKEGLPAFLDVAEQLPDTVSISFLGQDVMLADGPASSVVASRFGQRPHRWHDFHTAEETVQYLAAPHRIAVMPGVDQCDPHLALLCVANSIPLLASDIDTFRRVIIDPAVREATLFQPQQSHILRCCQRYLQTDAVTRLSYTSRSREALAAQAREQTLCQHYASLIDDPAEDTTPKAIDFSTANRPAARQPIEPLVSVVVPYYNLPEYLPETLNSLQSQDYPALEVIVINDGSTCSRADVVFERMKRRYPGFRFISQANRGLGGTRNRGLQEANGEYFLPVDADNVARPSMVRQFVEAMRRNPDLAGASCLFTAFNETDDLASKTYAYTCRPYGGPFAAAATHNVFGDANSIFRRDVLIDLGGYSLDRETTCEDWELFVKLVGKGHRVDTIPEYLFHYRHRAGSMLRTTDAFLNRSRVLRQFFEADQLSRNDRVILWTALVGAQATADDMAVARETPGVRPPGGRRRAWVIAEVDRVIKRLSCGQMPISIRSSRKRRAA